MIILEFSLTKIPRVVDIPDDSWGSFFIFEEFKKLQKILIHSHPTIWNLSYILT